MKGMRDTGVRESSSQFVFELHVPSSFRHGELENNTLRAMPRKAKQGLCRVNHTRLAHAWHQLLLNDFYADVHRLDRIIDRDGKRRFHDAFEIR